MILPHEVGFAKQTCLEMTGYILPVFTVIFTTSQGNKTGNVTQRLIRKALVAV
jgi:hypothetical protein